MESQEDVLIVLSSLIHNKKNFIDMLAVLLALKYHEPLGRVRLSTMLGLGERRTRNLLALLRGLGLIEQNKGGAWLTPKARRLLDSISVVDHYTTCCVVKADEHTIARALSKLLWLRDVLVVSLGTPSYITLLGAITGSNIHLPGVPDDVAREYAREVEKCSATGLNPSFFAIFNKPQCYHCCSALVHALTTTSRLEV